MKLNAIEKFAGSPGEDIEQWMDRALVAVAVLYDFEDGKEGDGKAKKKLAKCMPLLITGAAYTTWKQLSEEE